MLLCAAAHSWLLLELYQQTSNGRLDTSELNNVLFMAYPVVSTASIALHILLFEFLACP
jgi:hypothetical protein